MSQIRFVLYRCLSLIIAIGITISIFSFTSLPAESRIVAALGSKSSGNRVLESIEGGQDYKGMAKKDIITAIGEPWQKDTTPEKGRYDEKWIYSCETNNGLTYDCVYLYFMADRVVNVETF